MSMFVLAAALVAAAPEPAPAPAPVAPVAEQSNRIALDPSADTRRICVVDTTTGTRLSRRTCQTRAKWIAEGVDPLAKR